MSSSIYFFNLPTWLCLFLIHFFRQLWMWLFFSFFLSKFISRIWKSYWLFYIDFYNLPLCLICFISIYLKYIKFTFTLGILVLRVFWWDLYGLTCVEPHHQQTRTIWLPHFLFVCLLFFSCLTALVKFSSTVLSESNKTGHTRVIPAFGGNTLFFTN